MYYIGLAEGVNVEFTGFPRHQLRIMGRSKGRYSSRTHASPTNSTTKNSSPCQANTNPSVERPRLAAAPDCPESIALLNYLSEAAANYGKEILESENLPGFAKVRAPEVIVPPQRPTHVPDQWSSATTQKPAVAARQNFSLAEGALQGLADLLTKEAGGIERSTQTINKIPPCARPGVSIGPSSYALLDSWLNTGEERASDATTYDDTISYYGIEQEEEIETVALIESEANSAAEAQSAQARQAGRLMQNLSAATMSFAPNNTQPQQSNSSSRQRPALSRGHQDETPKMEMLAAGRRMESLENGAQIVKDSLGRVIEVRSPLGPVLRTRYDENGHLRFFVRTDQDGNIQSYGESDKQGVVVHDPEGRVRAAGESMAIDRVGRLSIVRKDGQFWSIDLARGFHVERRQMVDEDGQWKALTAVFAYDGFRMVTRFQSMTPDGASGAHKVVKEEIRLYGRDGSCAQFDSEESIEELRPCRVWPPASRAVEKQYRNRWQAGTAWQAVREYLELLQSGSG